MQGGDLNWKYAGMQDWTFFMTKNVAYVYGMYSFIIELQLKDMTLGLIKNKGPVSQHVIVWHAI